MNTPSILSMMSEKNGLSVPAGGASAFTSVPMLAAHRYGATIQSQPSPSAARAAGEKSISDRKATPRVARRSTMLMALLDCVALRLEACGESLLEKVELLLRRRGLLLHCRFLFLRGVLLRLFLRAAFFRAALTTPTVAPIAAPLPASLSATSPMT